MINYKIQNYNRFTYSSDNDVNVIIKIYIKDKLYRSSDVLIKKGIKCFTEITDSWNTKKVFFYDKITNEKYLEFDLVGKDNVIRNHTVITGTGRTGTTFIIQLLTNLGLDTGFDKETALKTNNLIGRAGLEFDIRKNSPYIVKSPIFCNYVNEVINNPKIILDHVFIPIRDIDSAAESRRFVTSQGSNFGGLWKTKSMIKGEQEKILMEQLYSLIYALSSVDVQITLIKYPLLTYDPIYLFNKLKPVLKDIKFDFFEKVFNETVIPDLVNKHKKMKQK